MKFMRIFLAALLAFVVGSFAVCVIWILIFVGAIGSMSTQITPVVDNSILKIDFAENITDAPSTDPFAGIDFASMEMTSSLSLLETLRAVEAAAADDRIKGIYLRMNGAGTLDGTGVMEELREALVQFKQSGKFVVSYNESYTQGSYYLATAADKIYLQPEGSMDWSGMASQVMFYKGLLDKLDLKVEIFRPTVCKYKSAVEPYFLKELSPANRAQMQQMIGSLWQTITEAVSASRGISVEELNKIADNLEVTLPQEALAHKMVDGVIYEDQMNEVFEELGVEADEEGNYHMISLGEYAAQVGVDVKSFSAPQVAVVYASGQIVDGEGYGDMIYGNSLAQMIRQVREDDQVKAVVLRVNSPGGSALASDVIWREMELLKSEKPVIVSMGSYAASGGYYISAPADVIVADKMTLTGSIGVFGMMLNPVDALKNKLGVTIDGVKTNRSAGKGGLSPLTAQQRQKIMRGVDRVYATFTEHVAQGRNLPLEKVLEVAEGRVWSGIDALPIGLIDGHGGLKYAIALAAEKADLGDEYRVVEQLEMPTGLAAYFSSFSARVKASWEASELGVMMKQYRTVQEALSQQGVVMYSPYKVELE
ncbi:MAG: signal peptide peptidase SppA [Alistipes sp.]|nr:signal peptide peptidase SppA [Alistipes sp.]